MAIQTWTEVITSSLQSLWMGFINFLPGFLGAIIIFIIGWVIASVLGKLSAQIIRVLRIDSILEKMGFKKSLERANLNLDSSKFISELVRWFFIIVFLMAATDILGLVQVTDFLSRILLYIPQLIAAVLILLAAVLIANFLQKLVKASVEAAGFSSANTLAAITKWSVLVFAILAALLQLGIAPALIQTIFTGFVAALVISSGLAFGLGGKEFAASILNKFRKDIKGE